MYKHLVEEYGENFLDSLSDDKKELFRQRALALSNPSSLEISLSRKDREWLQDDELDFSIEYHKCKSMLLNNYEIFLLWCNAAFVDNMYSRCLLHLIEKGGKEENNMDENSCSQYSLYYLTPSHGGKRTEVIKKRHYVHDVGGCLTKEVSPSYRDSATGNNTEKINIPYELIKNAPFYTFKEHMLRTQYTEKYLLSVIYKVVCDHLLKPRDFLSEPLTSIKYFKLLTILNENNITAIIDSIEHIFDEYRMGGDPPTPTILEYLKHLGDCMRKLKNDKTHKIMFRTRYGRSYF